MPFIGGAISGFGSLLGGIFGGNAAKSAANTQANAALQAAQLQNQQFQSTQNNLAPYRNAGTNALSALQFALGLGGAPPPSYGGTAPAASGGGGGAPAPGGVGGGSGTSFSGTIADYLNSGQSTLPNGYRIQQDTSPTGQGGYQIVSPQGQPVQTVSLSEPLQQVLQTPGAPYSSGASGGTSGTGGGLSGSPAPFTVDGQPFTGPGSLASPSPLASGGPSGTGYGSLLAPYNNGQPFAFNPNQSGLPSSALGPAGLGSPTVNANGTLQAPKAFSFAPYQTPAPFTYTPYQKPADFQFGTGQTGLSTQQPGFANSGVGTVSPGANGVAVYNAPTPFNYTAADFHASPGYNYALQQAQLATNNLASNQGGAFSGNTLKALQANATGLANQDFNSQEALAQQAYGLNSQNSQNAYLSNYNTAQNIYNTNANLGLQAFDTNFNAGLGAYTTNAQTGLAGYNTNFNNALNTYNTNLGAGEGIYNTNFNNAFNQYNTGFQQDAQTKQQTFNFLNALTGAGQNAAAQTGAFGANAASQIGNFNTQAANAQAAGTIGQAQALNQSITGVGNALGTANFLQNNPIALLQQTPAGGSDANGVFPEFVNQPQQQASVAFDPNSPQFAFNQQNQQTPGNF